MLSAQGNHVPGWPSVRVTETYQGQLKKRRELKFLRNFIKLFLAQYLPNLVYSIRFTVGRLVRVKLIIGKMLILQDAQIVKQRD